MALNVVPKKKQKIYFQKHILYNTLFSAVSLLTLLKLLSLACDLKTFQLKKKVDQKIKTFRLCLSVNPSTHRSD